MSVNFSSYSNEGVICPYGKTTMILSMTPYPYEGEKSFDVSTTPYNHISELKGDGCHLPLVPEAAVTPFQPIPCRENGKRYSKRIKKGEWKAHWPKIVELHAEKLTRIAILERLDKDCDFHPTLCQLNRRMEIKGLGKGGKITPGKGRTSKMYPSQLQPTIPELSSHDSGYPMPMSFNPSVLNHVAEGQQSSASGNKFQELCSIKPISEYSSIENSSDTSLESTDFHDIESDAAHRTPDVFASALGGLGLVLGARKEQETTLAERDPENAVWIESPSDHFGFSEYCQQACCAKLMRYHRTLLAANFLTCLQCWSQASEILHQLISEMEVDHSVSVSDRTWVKINYNRINGSLFQPGRRTSVWSTSGYTDMAKPLDDYLEEAESESLSSPLAHLCMTGQFRTAGIFEYYLPNSGSLDSFDKQVQALYLELVVQEERNCLILRLMLWCLMKLNSPTLRSELQQVNRQTTYTSRFRDAILPRLLSCHFVSEWIREPCQATMRLLAKLRVKSESNFKLDVMLPETFIVIGSMITARTDCFPQSFSASLIEGLLKSLKNATKKLCLLSPRHYCHEFAARLADLYNQSSAYGHQVLGPGDNLATEVANKIIGGSDHLGGSCNWMRWPDTFKVHYLGKLDAEIEPTFEPTLLATSRKLRTASSSSSKSTCDQSSTLSKPDSTMRPPSTSSTIDSRGQECGQAAVHGSPRLTPAKRLKQRPEIPPRRYLSHTTNSSGHGSLKEMREIHARTSAEAWTRKEGVQDAASRTASTLSKMSLGTQVSSSKVLFGIDRMNSKTSSTRFSFVREDVFMTDVPPALYEQVFEPSGQQRDDLPDSDLQRSISAWVKECVAQQQHDMSSPRQSYIVEERIDEE